MPLDSDKLYDRIDYLRQINRDSIIDRSRIRDIMNGGEAAVKALLGGSMNVEYHELPAPNLFLTLVAIASQTSSETAPYLLSLSSEIFNNEFFSSLL